jgi:lipopolysaccharide transport system ATP-binding protein
MYVRLAFAVAAHLETDILIVDEVLAVGDAEFQKRCIGKMQEVSRSGGRTVLFVSHNMSAVQALTRRCVLLRNGAIEAAGPTDAVISHYASMSGDLTLTDVREIPRHSPHLGILARICEIRPSPSTGESFLFGETLKFSILARISTGIPRIRCGITILDVGGAPIMTAFSSVVQCSADGGEVAFELTIPDSRLAPGTYSLDLSMGEGGRSDARVEYDIVKNGPLFSVASISISGQPILRWMREYGNISTASARLKRVGATMRESV